jgi:predicted nucleotidyltransferase
VGGGVEGIYKYVNEVNERRTTLRTGDDMESMESIEKKLNMAVEKIKHLRDSDKVKFIILYGSASREKTLSNSDIDISIYYDCESFDEISRFRLKILSELFDESYDVQMFQQLPLYVKIEVLKGKPIYCKDIKFLYEVALQTIKDFDDFKHRFYDYIRRNGSG